MHARKLYRLHESHGYSKIEFQLAIYFEILEYSNVINEHVECFILDLMTLPQRKLFANIFEYTFNFKFDMFFKYIECEHRQNFVKQKGPNF